MHFFRALAVGSLVSLISPLSGAERMPGIYKVVKPQSLPIQWEGRVIGQLVLPVGKEIEVIKIEGGVFTCRNARQTFTLMEDCLEPVAATSMPVPVMAGPATSPLQPETLAEPPAVAEPVPEPSPVPSALPEWKPVENYLAAVAAYLDATALNVRYFQYAKLGRWSGREVRSHVRRWKGLQTSDARASMARALDAAFSAYDRELWTRFEVELRTALEARKANPVP